MNNFQEEDFSPSKALELLSLHNKQLKIENTLLFTQIQQMQGILGANARDLKEMYLENQKLKELVVRLNRDLERYQVDEIRKIWNKESRGE